MAAEPTVLIVPCLRRRAANHWQALLHAELPNAVTLPRMDGNFSCDAWVAAIEHAIAAIRGRVVVVAHSLGVMMVAHWARRHSRPIDGALLATPPDLETAVPPGCPSVETLRENGWLPTPRERLPFRSIVAASTNDPTCRFTTALALGQQWGSRVVRIGNVGQLTPAWGYGPWPKAHELIRQLTADLPDPR